MRWSLLLVPVAIILELTLHDQQVVVFFALVLAMIPLAALMGESTEHLSAHVGPSVGGLLNATFGNLAELILLIAMLSKGLYEIVLAGIFGGIVANALLATGISMFSGGLKYHIQEYNRENTRDLATLLTIAIFGLLVISVISFNIEENYEVGAQVSLAISPLLLLGYGMYLFYSMKTHKELFESSDEEGESEWSIWTSIAVLAGVTLLVVYISESLSVIIEEAVTETEVNQLFIGAVIIAVIGAAAEIASAVRASRKNRMDLALTISMGGSVQIALFVAPVVVILGYFFGPTPFGLMFDYESVIVLFFSAVITMQLARDGRSTWFKGALLLLVYLLIAVGIWLLPV